jgi:hypothetical protein
VRQRHDLALEAKHLLDSIGGSLSPEDRQLIAEFQVHKGRIALLLGDSEAARASFVRALEFDPSNANALKQLH